MNLDQIEAADLLTRPAAELDRLATRLRKNSGALPGGTPLKVAVLTSFTSDYLVDMLRLMLAHRGFAADIVACGYSQMVHELLAGGPALASAPDLVFVLPTHRDLRHAPRLDATREQAANALAVEAAFWGGLLDRVAVPTIMLSFDMPLQRALGEADGLLPGGLGRHVRGVNAALADRLDPSVSLVDAEALQARIGPDGFDPRLYALCKQPFAMAALPEVADTLAAAAAARLGRARKVLVLDLDHTIWGGVVGDVGIEGLALGAETAEGEAFIAFQHYAQALARRGIILAVCSKNYEEVARAAFRDHTAMVLTLDDIACFVANFDDKATNLRTIARTLNVGLDALVFVDDNPVERAWVRQQLPEVWTIELPEEPALYAQAIEAAKPFPLHRLTREDLGRNASYQAVAQMRAQAGDAAGIEGFLHDLAPVATVEAIDSGTLDRVTQLIGKTNQFRLNPTAFTLADIRARGPDVVALRLSDRLQDYGIVAVAVTERRGDTFEVLNWVMSCRVFSRRLEHAMRQVLGARAAATGATAIVARYVPSKKNALVPDALAAVGFRDQGEGRFVAAVADPPAAAHHMTIVSLAAPIPIDGPAAPARHEMA